MSIVTATRDIRSGSDSRDPHTGPYAADTKEPLLSVLPVILSASAASNQPSIPAMRATQRAPASAVYVFCGGQPTARPGPIREALHFSRTSLLDRYTGPHASASVFLFSSGFRCYRTLSCPVLRTSRYIGQDE